MAANPSGLFGQYSSRQSGTVKIVRSHRCDERCVRQLDMRVDLGAVSEHTRAPRVGWTDTVYRVCVCVCACDLYKTAYRRGCGDRIDSD